MATVRRHSSLTDSLPSEIMAQVNRLLIEPSTTYDDVKTFLEEKGFDISRSAIGRYGKDFFANFQQQKLIEEQAKTLVSEADENGLVLEEATAKIFARQILEGVMSGALDIEKMPRIISDFAKLQSSSIQREKLKVELRRQVLKEVAETVDRTAKKAGVTPEAIALIHEALGI